MEARATRKLVLAFSAIRLEEHPCTHKEPILQMGGNGRSFTHSPDGGYLASTASNMVTKLLRNYDQEKRQTDGSGYWDTLRPKGLHKKDKNFDDGYWLMLILEGSNTMRIEFCKENNGYLCHERSIQGHSGGIPISPELMNYTVITYNWKEHIYHIGIMWNFQSILGSGRILGRKRMTGLDNQSSVHS